MTQMWIATLVAGALSLAVGSLPVAAGGTHELRQTSRGDGSTIDWVLDRRGITGPQGVLVLVQGSGCESVLENRALEEARSMAPHKAVVMIERYGVPPGHAPDDIMADCPSAFFERHTVSGSATDLVAVMAELRREDWWSGRLTLFGGSEGGAVVSLAAPMIPETDAVIVLSSGLGMTFAETLAHVLPPQARAEVARHLDEIRADPESTKRWGGHSYRWLADVLDRRYVDELLATDASILIIQGGRDTQSPPASTAPVREAFQRAGRTNLTYWDFGEYDHWMMDARGVSRLSEVLEEAAAWLARTVVPPSALRAQAPADQDPEIGVETPGWVMLSGDPAIAGSLDWTQVYQACAMEAREAGESQMECVRRRAGPSVRVFPLHVAPDPDSWEVGRLLIVWQPEQPLAALFLPTDSLETRHFVPDLYDPDWGYGPPWFHQTLLDRQGEWYRLPRRPFPEPVWAPMGREGRDVQMYHLEPEGIYTALGSLAERPGVTSEDGGTVVVSLSEDAVFLRPEERWDMPCGLHEPLPSPPGPGVQVPFRELYDEDLHLLLRVRYTRGC